MDEVDVVIQFRCPTCGRIFAGCDEARVRYNMQVHSTICKPAIVHSPDATTCAQKTVGGVL